jgi:hypothetical protein
MTYVVLAFRSYPEDYAAVGGQGGGAVVGDFQDDVDVLACGVLRYVYTGCG